MIELVPLDYYTKVFYWVMFVLCLLTALYYQGNPGCEKLLRQNSILLPFLLTVIMIVYIGLRPVSFKYFGDMGYYRHAWNTSDIHSNYQTDFKGEWLFSLLMRVSKATFTSEQIWFLIIDVIYIGCQFWACKKLLWENVWFAIMFVFFSFQFFTYGTNGLRNGMGCAFLLLSISFFCDRNKVGYFIGIFLFFLAMGCHRSSIVPMAALIISLFVIKDIKTAVYIWLGCIILSLFAGNIFMSLFGSLGFDVRMTNYSSLSESRMSQFSHIGFRWDFLLYSAMPVWLAWYMNYKGIIDKTFTLLANTYIIANSFWVLVCRVAFSNRFAYLSWFMYALVIAYAVVRVPIWKNQDKIAGQILIAHSAFTMIMFLFF